MVGSVPTLANQVAAAPLRPTGMTRSSSVKATAAQTDNAATKEEKKTYVLPDKQPGELPQMMTLSRPVINRSRGVPRTPDVKSGTITVTNGFGTATSVTATANLGASVNVDVDITMRMLTEDSITDITKAFEQELTDDEKKSLNQNGTYYGTALGFFAGAFGILGGGGKNYNENSTRKYNVDNNEKLKTVTEAFKSSQQADIRITGELSVTGVSLFYQSEASLLIEVLKVEIGEEEYMLVSDNATAYDASRQEVLPPPKEPLMMVPLGL